MYNYYGMNYTQCSKEAERLINKYGWYASLDKLIFLYHRMETLKKVNG